MGLLELFRLESSEFLEMFRLDTSEVSFFRRKRTVGKRSRFGRCKYPTGLGCGKYPTGLVGLGLGGSASRLGLLPE